MFSFYTRALKQRPVATKTLTAITLATVGDLLAQRTSGAPRARADDYARTARFAAWAGLIAPLTHMWFARLSRLPSPLLAAAADQLLWAPPFTAMFLFAMGAAEAGTVGEGVSRCRSSWRSVLLANWLVWMPVQALNFWLVPLPFQVLVTNVVGLGWSVALSAMSQKKGDKAPKEAPADSD